MSLVRGRPLPHAITSHRPPAGGYKCLLPHIFSSSLLLLPPHTQSLVQLSLLTPVSTAFTRLPNAFYYLISYFFLLNTPPNPQPKAKMQYAIIAALAAGAMAAPGGGPVYKTTPVYTPPPVYSSSPAPVYSSSPAPVYSSSPAPVYSSSPAPVYSSSPAPVYSSAPAPVYSSAPAPVYSSSPAPYYTTTVKTYSTYETYCSEPTTLTYSTQTYTVTEPCTVTYSCPCTMTETYLTSECPTPTPAPVYTTPAPPPVYTTPAPAPVYNTSVPVPVYTTPAPPAVSFLPCSNS